MIFREFAPIYWAHGVSAIPLRVRHKAPAIDQWSVYGSQMPSKAVQELWLQNYAAGNIGLALGTASGVCAIDIDTEDEGLVAALLNYLPKSPWVRVGKKGMALAYRFEGQRNFKLRDGEGNMICEFLGLGNQMVLPPSIHPDTGKEYTANCNLWEVLDQLPALGLDIENQLRAMLVAAGVSLSSGARAAPLDVVASGDRDNQLVRQAGYLARVVLGIDRTAEVTLAEAIMQIYTWVEQFTAKVSGDSLDPNKGVTKLLEFIVRDVEKGKTLPNGWDVGLDEAWQEHPTIVWLREQNADRRWTLEKVRGWLAQNVSEDEDACGEAAMQLIGMVAKDDKFNGLLWDKVREEIHRILGIKISKGDLTKTLKGLKGASDGEEEDHETIARNVLADLNRVGEIRFDKGQFWQWSGSYFRAVGENELYMYVATNVKGSTLVRRDHEYTAIVKVLARMCERELVECVENGVNFVNGWVGEDLVVVDHDPKYGATFTLPFEYNRDLAGKAYRWFGYLASIWGHEPDYEDRLKCLQEMFAATLFKIAPRYQRAFLLYGRAGSGKSQILRVLRELVPKEAVAELPPEQWGERFALTSMVGKAINICGELPETGMIAGDKFKQIVEGERVETEYKGMNRFAFYPECANWFASNYLPHSRDTSQGFSRRWLILDFNRVVPREEIVVGLAELILAEERDAIVAWACEGLRRLLDQGGYTEPACHLKRLESIRRVNNSVYGFLDQKKDYVRGDGEVGKREFYDRYALYMKDYGRGKAVSYARFGEMLEDLDLKVEVNQLGDEIVIGIVDQNGRSR